MSNLVYVCYISACDQKINSADPNYFIKSYNFSNFVEHSEET